MHQVLSQVKTRLGKSNILQWDPEILKRSLHNMCGTQVEGTDAISSYLCKNVMAYSPKMCRRASRAL